MPGQRSQFPVHLERWGRLAWHRQLVLLLDVGEDEEFSLVWDQLNPVLLAVPGCQIQKEVKVDDGGCCQDASSARVMEEMVFYEIFYFPSMLHTLLYR